MGWNRNTLGRFRNTCGWIHNTMARIRDTCGMIWIWILLAVVIALLVVAGLVGAVAFWLRKRSASIQKQPPRDSNQCLEYTRRQRHGATILRSSIIPCPAIPRNRELRRLSPLLLFNYLDCEPSPARRVRASKTHPPQQSRLGA